MPSGGVEGNQYKKVYHENNIVKWGHGGGELLLRGSLSLIVYY